MAHVKCKVSFLFSKIDKATNKVLDEKPLCLTAGDAAFVEIVLLNDIVMETHTQVPSLGRFILRENNQIFAVGVVKQKTLRQID
jgi:translation elongation factor EF-1alpha